MTRTRSRAYPISALVALVFAGILAGAGVPPASAEVTAVQGSAFGYLAPNVVIFGGAQQATGPSPTVTLPAAGSVNPVSGTAPTGVIKYGPATLFSSGVLNVSTEGTTGATGSVKSSASISNLNTSKQEILTADAISSTCTASEPGRSGSTTVTNGILRVSEGNPDVQGDDTNVTLPASPAPNTSYDGKLEAVNDTFRVVFNEQMTNADGSLTVNAVHEFLLGPTATGDIIIGQSVCGVAVTAGTTTTAAGATTTTAAGGTTTTAAGGTTTTTGATTTTAGPTTTSTTAASGAAAGAGGGAYGFYTKVSLFGGAAGIRGPVPTVDLPAGGSATPVTASAPDGDAKFGPAVIFTSGKLDVSTQGTPGGTVTSSATVDGVNKSGQEQLTAATVSSKCTSSSAGETGSATVSGGKLITSSGTNFDIDTDDTVVTLPADPAPNTSFDGKIENVGDTFKVVLNEQTKSAGAITVNAVHLYLNGPVAVGELIIGQSRCATTAAGASTSGGGGGGTAGGQTLAAQGAGGLAGTGSAIAVFVALALLLLTGGWSTLHWSAGVRWRTTNGRRMPWRARGLLR